MQDKNIIHCAKWKDIVCAMGVQIHSSYIAIDLFIG
jgi:hypothetical protein